MDGSITSFDGKLIPASSSEMKSKFSEAKYVAENGVAMMFRYFVPPVGEHQKVPLIIYLHGAGQNGDDNICQLDRGVGCLYSFMKGREDYQAILVAPQCPVGVYWRNEDVLEALKQMIEYFAKHSYVDETRIYITGFSMGGDAAWQLALKYPFLMTTIIPVCGGPMVNMKQEIPHVPTAMVDLNIWAFNNFDDPIVRPNFSKCVISQLWIFNDADNINFTENISGGHNGEAVFRNRDVWIWMFSTHRAEPKTFPTNHSNN